MNPIECLHPVQSSDFFLRHDNADLRLRDYGYKVGLVNEETYQEFIQKKRLLEQEIKRFKKQNFKTFRRS